MGIAAGLMAIKMFMVTGMNVMRETGVPAVPGDGNYGSLCLWTHGAFEALASTMT